MELKENQDKLRLEADRKKDQNEQNDRIKSRIQDIKCENNQEVGFFLVKTYDRRILCLSLNVLVVFSWLLLMYSSRHSDRYQRD